jgi:hypothetical protein
MQLRFTIRFSSLLTGRRPIADRQDCRQDCLPTKPRDTGLIREIVEQASVVRQKFLNSVPGSFLMPAQNRVS